MGEAGTTYGYARRAEHRVLVWERSALWGDNIVVINDAELAVGRLSRERLVMARPDLEAGKSLYEVLGHRATYLPFSKVQRIRAVLNSPDLIVQHRAGSRQITRRIGLNDSEVQAEVLLAAQERIGPGTQVVRGRVGRLIHMFMPLNLCVLLLLTAVGFHHFATEVFRASGEKRVVRDEIRYQHSHGRLRYMQRNRTWDHAALAIGAAILVTGLLLYIFGYQLSLTILLSAALVAALWALSRFLFRPSTVTLIASA